jgi:eukaryotic-like serine/threonine-protein kinase
MCRPVARRYAPPVRFTSGQSLGRYRVDALVGRGGMGEVYKAWDTELGRAVAIKTLREDASAVGEDGETLSDDEQQALQAALVARFSREAKLASRFVHAGFCAVFDVQEADGVPYIAMEWLDGEPLQKLIRRSAIGTARKVRWLTTLAEALADAHRAGIIHRDFKPGNVMITQAGAPKILDFGLAKKTPRLDDTQPLGPPSFRTATGVVLGTPRYMPPEQVAGAELTDARADQYAWGVTAYELLSGTHPSLALEPGAEPFPIGSARSLDSLVPDLPVGIAEVVGQTLAALPSERLASMDVVAERLRACVDAATSPTETIAERPSTPTGRTTSTGRSKRRTFRLFAISAGLTVTLVGGLLVTSIFGLRGMDRERAAATTPDASAASATTGAAPSPSGAPGPSPSNAPSAAAARSGGPLRAHTSNSPHADAPAAPTARPSVTTLSWPSPSAGASGAAPTASATTVAPAPPPPRTGPRQLRVKTFHGMNAGYPSDTVAAAMQAIRPALEACYRAPSYDGSNDGQVTMTPYIDENGAVTRVELAASGGVAPDLAACLDRAARRLRLPPHPRSWPTPVRAYLEIR